jgi:hypothetical protein
MRSGIATKGVETELLSAEACEACTPNPIPEGFDPERPGLAP